MNKDDRLCWYHGKLSRDQAEELVKVDGNEDGTFLVRESTTAAGDFVLTLLYQGEVCHYQIRRYGEDAFFSIEDKMKILHGLDTLVEFYQQDANGLVTQLKKYIKKDPPPNDTRSHGNTNLLHRAVMKNNHIIVSELVKCGYRNVDAKNQNGQTAVHLTCLHGDEAMLQLLINAGVNVNCMDTLNYMPLHYACRQQSRIFIRTLLAAQANIQGRNIKNGYVPMHEAAKHGNLEAVEELLNEHAPLLPRTAMGEFPIDLAKEFGHETVVNYLEQYKLPPAITFRSQWYHGTLKREEAIDVLETFADNLKSKELKNVKNEIINNGDILESEMEIDTSGAFLIRFSDRKNSGSGYVLTMLFNNIIKNFIISQSSKYLFIDDGPFLPSLEHLVEHFMRFSDGLPTNLKYAVPPKPKPPLPLFSTMPRHATHKKSLNLSRIKTDIAMTSNTLFNRIDDTSKPLTANHTQNFFNNNHQHNYNHTHTHHHLNHNNNNKKKKETTIGVFSTLRTLRSPKKSNIMDSMTMSRKHNKLKNKIKSFEENNKMDKSTTLLSEEELRQTESLLKTLSFSTEFSSLNQQLLDDFYKIPRNNSAISNLELDNNNVKSLSKTPISAKSNSHYVSKKIKNMMLDQKSDAEVEYFTKSDILIERERCQIPNNDCQIKMDSEEYIPNVELNGKVDQTVGELKNDDTLACNESITSDTSQENGILHYLKQHSEIANEISNPTVKMNYFLPRDLLVLEAIIGEGEFGSVFRGYIKEPNESSEAGKESLKRIDIAVKTLRDEHCRSSKQEFLREADVMIRLKHHCIVQLIGISKGETLMMVQELVPFGSMLHYILEHKDHINVNYELKLWASQIACGMEYLESQHFVHRDLAARNILLASKNQAKISDFGLSRALGNDNECYQASQGGKWPIKWYAPESFNNGLFSHASDVWSFGVTLWEMFSLGEPPYGDMRGVEAIQLIENGQRLQQPILCPDHIYEIMHNCWNYKPKDRPNFFILRDFFSRDPDYQNIVELIQTEHIS